MAGAFLGPLRRAIHALKYGGDTSVADLLASGLGEVPPVDALAYVPAPPRRRRARGYDHAALLARSLGHRLGIPVAAVLGRSVRDLHPQAGGSRSEREGNVSGTFVVRADPPVRLILVDDVITTGATVAAAARPLVALGCLVHVAVIAATPLQRAPPIPEAWS